MKKMKKKIAILIGIAVCVMLLASPVLASAGYSKIYGNANEDDVLDMRDVTYIKLVIFGKKPATTFADANYDGKISMLDVGQTKLIILGREKKLTLVDQYDRTETINKPVERVISTYPAAARAIIGLGAADKLVGISNSFYGYLSKGYLSKVFPEGKNLPIVSDWPTINIELVVAQKPDVVLAYGGSVDIANDLQEKTGIPVICTTALGEFGRLYDEFRLIGTVVEKEEEAEELLSYFNDKLNMVTEVTSEIAESEKQKVYLAFWSSIVKTPVSYVPVDIAGGINVADSLTGTLYAGEGVEVSKEQIVKWNPDIILIHGGPTHSRVKAEDILSDSALQTINAVKNHKVYYTYGYCWCWEQPRVITEVLYMAKLFYPDKFEDLDVEKEGNEIFKRFYGVNDLYTELGTELGYL